jgi:MarR family 2-MHQ and catechol resistance regulon transcriptional repressor
MGEQVGEGERDEAREELERPGPGDDLNAMLIYNLCRTHAALGPFLDAHLRHRRLTASQFNTLLILRKAGRTGLRMGEIGRRLVVTKSNVTGLIDRLEAQGLVVRIAVRDRRATLVRLTLSGRTLLGRALPGHGRLVAQLGQSLRPREKELLIRLLSKFRRALRRGEGGHA